MGLNLTAPHDVNVNFNIPHNLKIINCFLLALKTFQMKSA